jgi:hypothetical protein
MRILNVLTPYQEHLGYFVVQTMQKIYELHDPNNDIISIYVGQLYKKQITQDLDKYIKEGK